MHHLKGGCCRFLKRQNGTKEHLFLILGAKGLQHGLYLYPSLRMNGQHVLSLPLHAAPRAMKQICITPCQATQKCKIIVNRILMKTKGIFRVFLSVSSPHMTSFPFLNFQIECSLVLTAFGLHFLNPAQDARLSECTGSLKGFSHEDVASLYTAGQRSIRWEGFSVLQNPTQ